MYFTILLCLKIFFKYYFLQDDIEIDLDEVLDMEDESERKTYISVSFNFLKVVDFHIIFNMHFSRNF